MITKLTYLLTYLQYSG